MQNSILANFYERDIDRLIKEIKSFSSDEDIWKTAGTIKNSAGNLVLHIIGGSKYLIGDLLGGISYKRDRENEFQAKDIPTDLLVNELEQLKNIINTTLAKLSANDMESVYPISFDGGENTIGYVLFQLFGHLNYHLGQVSYLRRVLHEDS